MVKDAVHLSDAGLQCTENAGIRKERNDRRDDELGLRNKRREGTECMYVRRVYRKSDFLVSFSELSNQDERQGILADEKGWQREPGESYSRMDEIRIGLVCFAAW